MHTKHQLGKIIFFIIRGDREDGSGRVEREKRKCAVSADRMAELTGRRRVDELTAEAAADGTSETKTATATSKAEHEVRSRRPSRCAKGEKRKKREVAVASLVRW